VRVSEPSDMLVSQSNIKALVQSMTIPLRLT
jgi:hypothetical protein